MDRISLQMYTVREFTKSIEGLEETLDKLKKIGFRLLQYSIPDSMDPKEVKKLFDAAGIRNDSVFCRNLALEARTKDIISQCELFETKYVRVDSIPRDLSNTAAGYKMYAHYLNEVTQELGRHGIKLLYHFHAFEFIPVGNGKKGIEVLLEETDPERVQIIPDTHWIQSGGCNPADFLKKWKSRFDYMHAKDFTIGRMGQTWEARPIQFAAVGEGALDWKAILKVCKDNHVISYAIEQDDCYGRDPFDCVKSSYDFLKKCGVDD